jgi:DNA polymerase III sliding clamp (beta) subunit (PCNA family)
MYNKHNLAIAKIASKSSVRPELSGVYFTKDETVATDSFRLIEITTPKDCDIDNFPNPAKPLKEFKPFIVSAKEISKFRLEENENVPIVNNAVITKISDTQVQLATTNLESLDTKTFRLIEGDFPDYEPLFPAYKPVTEITINGKFLIEMLSLLKDLDKNGYVKMKIYKGNGEGKIVLESSNEFQQGRGLLMAIRDKE